MRKILFWLVLVCYAVAYSTVHQIDMSLSKVEQEAVTNFQKYLRIASVHPDINYDECVKFLMQLGKDVGLDTRVFRPIPNKPIVIMTYEGSHPELPTLLLNSHMDVVPVHEKYWNRDPFGAEIDEKGNIYARGAQDMKSIGMEYVEAVRRCAKNGRKFKRTIHLSFVPDEETTGDGMKSFVKTEDFKNLNVGCVIDESMPSESEEFLLSYAERSTWYLDIVCSGVTGHGSLLLDDTAGEKLRYVMDRFMDFRESEKQKLLENPNMTLGDVTTVNLMIIKGGVQPNVLPSTLSALFALRVAVDVDCDKLLQLIHKWCADAGEGVFCKESVIDIYQEVTKLDDTNPWWLAFQNSCNQMKLKIKPLVMPGATDSRLLRKLGIQAFGFSAINNTKNLLHNHDEYLNRRVFLDGIDIYYNIISNLANV